MGSPIRVGIVGMGGFAGCHNQNVKLLQDAGKCRLVCACDPNPVAFKDKMEEWDFSGRGVLVFDDYLKMLDGCRVDLDVVTIPTPVPLHAAMHKACVERGLPVYLEKPPTLDYAELEEMLEVEQKAVKPTQVGFNFISDPMRQQIKKRILNGEFGPVRKVCFKGIWPRMLSYFGRASWAGRLMMDDRLVLDSCMGNAMAHHIHNVLFWAGSEELFSWAEIQGVEAELYRAHNIEGTDTVFAKATTSNGTEVQIALTHACQGDQTNPEWVICDDAVIYYTTREGYEIRWNDGRIEEGPDGGQTETSELLDAYFAYIRGESERPVTKLIDSRPFVHFADLVYVAAGKITSISPQHVERFDAPEESSEGVAIENIRGVADEFFKSGRFPSDQAVSWGVPGGSASVEDLSKLRDVVRGMLAERGRIL